MRLGLTLTIAFIGLASLVGLVGYLFDDTSEHVLLQVESLRRSSIAEVVGATEMTLALQTSQIAAQRLLAERYRARVEPDHESEWGSAEDIDVDGVRDSLEAFQAQLNRSWAATQAAFDAARQSEPGEADATSLNAVQRLVALEREFAVHRTMMDRFIHLARYHPSGQIREYVDEELEPHYQNKLLYEVEALGRSSIAEVVGADEMTLALKASQIAARKLLAQRNDARVETDHESEWGSTETIDVDEVRHSLNGFQEQLTQSWEALYRVLPAGAGEAGVGSFTAVKRLLALERGFAAHRTKMDRFIHLARYHPSDQIREYVERELEPHYRDKMLGQIRAYEREAKAGLAKDVTSMETALAAANRRNRTITLIALLGAIALGLLLARSISKPLNDLADAAQQIGQGNLDAPIAVKGGHEVGVLARSFQQMAQDLKASTVSRSYLDNILQNMKDMLIVTDVNERISMINRAACDALGYQRDDLIGQPMRNLLGSPDGQSGELNPDPPGAWEGQLQSSQGAAIPVHCSSSPLFDSNGNPAGSVYVAQDISERHEADARLKKSLGEKEILLKEVHHRVKNNLQIISSLLDLQSQEAVEPATSRGLRDSQSRIRAMALIHEQLYRSDDLTNIDFGEYVERLIHHLEHTFGSTAHRITTELKIDSHPMSIDRAIPLGMIVSELVGNALEHAFPERTGHVLVEFSSEDPIWCLRICDDGIGLPTDFDPSTAGSLGLKLVGALAGQLGGELSYRVADGTEVSLRYAASMPSSATDQVPLS